MGITREAVRTGTGHTNFLLVSIVPENEHRFSATSTEPDGTDCPGSSPEEFAIRRLDAATVRLAQ